MYDIFLEAVVLVLQCLLVVCVLSYSNAVCGPTMRPRPNGPHVSMSVDNGEFYRLTVVPHSFFVLVVIRQNPWHQLKYLGPTRTPS